MSVESGEHEKVIYFVSIYVGSANWTNSHVKAEVATVEDEEIQAYMSEEDTFKAGNEKNLKRYQKVVRGA